MKGIEKDMQSDKPQLPPLPPKLDGENAETELHFTKCNHELKIITSTEVRCNKCGAGWHGPEVYKLVTQVT